MKEIIVPVAAVVVPVATVLWYFIGLQIRNSIQDLRINLNADFKELYERVARIEGGAGRRRQLLKADAVEA